jgi:HAD superfamily hydrolase (TIGR01662 family)
MGLMFRGNVLRLVIFDVDGVITYLSEPDVACEGSVETIRFLKECGVGVAIYTAKSGEQLKKRFTQAGISLELFDVIVCLAPKYRLPADPLMEILRQMQVMRNQTVYVGDQAEDMDAAKRSCVPFIGVSDVLMTESEFRAAGAETVINDLVELRSLFSRL